MTFWVKVGRPEYGIKYTNILGYRGNFYDYRGSLVLIRHTAVELPPDFKEDVEIIPYEIWRQPSLWREWQQQHGLQ